MTVTRSHRAANGQRCTSVETSRHADQTETLNLKLWNTLMKDKRVYWLDTAEIVESTDKTHRYTNTHAHMHTYTHTHTLMRTHAHTHRRACARTHTRMYERTRAHMHARTHTHTLSHTHTCTHTHMYTHLLLGQTQVWRASWHHSTHPRWRSSPWTRSFPAGPGPRLLPPRPAHRHRPHPLKWCQEPVTGSAANSPLPRKNPSCLLVAAQGITGANEAALGKKHAFSSMGIRTVSAMGIRCCVKEAINQALAFVNLACPVIVQCCITLR